MRAGADDQMNRFLDMFRSILPSFGVILGAVSCSFPMTGVAETSAPSSHFVFDDSFPGDILIHQVRVPTGGEATFTYYETLGWRGKAAGYAGIQSHPKGRNFIFSIWDNKSHRQPIRAVHAGAGTKVETFGGEGTGLKTWNFELGWDLDAWQTFVARAWPVGDHTHVGLWVRSGEQGAWNLISTMDVATEDAYFEGGNDAFIEDWLNTGENLRKMHLRKGWRRDLEGQWFATRKGRYSVNSWDLTEGKRSYQYRRNWNGGVEEDADGRFYFMTSGGKETAPTADNPSEHAIPRADAAPQLLPLQIKRARASLDEGNSLKVSWETVPTTLPQFSYSIEVYDNRDWEGDPIAKVSELDSETRAKTVQLSGLTKSDSFYVRLTCRDLLDNEVSREVDR